MKIIILSILLLASVKALAENIDSEFGYSIDIPNTWVSLTGKELKDNPDLFDAKNMKGVAPELLKQITPMIKSGKLEYYFMSDSTQNFADNINIVKQVGRVPSSAAEIDATCKVLPQQFTSMFKRPIKVFRCEKTKLDDKDGFYLEYDGVLPETKSLQFMVTKSENVYFIITATIKNSSYDSAAQDFHRVVKTFKTK